MVKQVVFENAWIVGVADTSVEPENLTYVLYPIESGRNDVQIETIDSAFRNEIQEAGLRFVGLYRENPIMSNPKEYARRIVQSYVLGAIQDKILDNRTEFVAREIVFSFANRYREVLGLEERDAYSIAEL